MGTGFRGGPWAGSEPRGTTGTLLFGPFHLQALFRVIAVEQLVAVGAGVGALCDPSKPVEIELSLERCELRMPKISRQNIRHKPIRIPNTERIPPRQPRHHGGIFFLKHFHELAGKRIRVSGG